MNVATNDLDLASLDPTDRFDAWQNACAQSFLGDQFWASPGSEEEFQGVMRRCWIDDLLFVEFDCQPFSGRFNADSEANDYVGVGIATRNQSELVTTRDDRQFDLSATSFVWDNARIKDFSQNGPGRYAYLFFPRTVLPPSANLANGLLRNDLISQDDSQLVRMLGALIRSLCVEARAVETATALAVRNAVLELLAGASHGDIPLSNAAVSDAMRTRIERWIDSRLLGETVSPGEAALAHGISVRSVHRLFSKGGESFGSVVRGLRLRRSRDDLLLTSHSIQAVAMRWGFADASHFCREFKHAYGLSPGEYRMSKRRHAG